MPPVQPSQHFASCIPRNLKMAASKLKLHYFDVRGRAEVDRLILAAAGKDFDEVRFSLEDWPSHKPKSPYGQAPWMEVDGVPFAQSLAIHSFLARELGFHGRTSLEMFKIDEIVHLLDELFTLAASNYHIDDEEEKAEDARKIKEQEAPKFLGFFEEILQKNETGYLVGDRLTLADIALFDACTGFLSDYMELTHDYPMVQHNVELVKGNDKIAEYLVSRN
ncbi:unnamed protein product [Lymnaea stagnalis]|uniref:Glutathione transferase n=1 Tax=Lymnaea stagnalis TaxID=6523 RepID=A0AAV2IM34_LYMST